MTRPKHGGRALARPAGLALAVIMGLLVSSGALRIATGAGPALALAETAVADLALDDTESCAGAPTGALLEALTEREGRVTARETALEDRMQALRVAEADLAERIAQLQEAELTLEATLARAETANDTDITNLVAIYENMKPPEAAALFETMTPDFAAGFVSRMRPDAAAAVLARLDPQTAHAISAVIAGRNANAPRE